MTVVFWLTSNSWVILEAEKLLTQWMSMWVDTWQCWVLPSVGQHTGNVNFGPNFLLGSYPSASHHPHLKLQEVKIHTQRPDSLIGTEHAAIRLHSFNKHKITKKQTNQSTKTQPQTNKKNPHLPKIINIFFLFTYLVFFFLVLSSWHNQV